MRSTTELIIPSVFAALCTIGFVIGQSNSIDSQSSCDGKAGSRCVKFYQCGDKSEQDPYSENFLVDFKAFSKQECSVGDVCCPKANQLEQPIGHLDYRNADTQCGQRNATGVGMHIANLPGNRTQFGEFPWAIAVLERIDGKLELVCSGTLIEPNVVLVAAHNFYNKNQDSFIIRAGEWDASSDGGEGREHQDREIKKIVFNNFQVKTGVNDIALIFLKKKFQLKPHIRTVCLPENDELFINSACHVAAWGKASWNQPDFTALQKRVDLRILSRGECNEKLRPSILGDKYVLPEASICAAGDVDEDTCTGDGGAALVCPLESDGQLYYVQAGIVSWGIRCNNQFPGVYTNVALFRQWIDDQMDGNGYETKYYEIQHKNYE